MPSDPAQPDRNPGEPAGLQWPLSRAETERAQQEVAREIVAELLNRPQPSADRPAVGFSGSPGQQFTQGGPLAAQVLGERQFARMMPVRLPPRVPDPGRGVSQPGGSAQRRRKAESARRRQAQRSNAQQPRRARMTNQDLPTVAEAFEGMIGELGRRPDREHLFGGCHSGLWIDPEGDGVLLVRMSSNDIKKSQTPVAQYAETQAVLARAGKRWRYLLVVIGMSGGHRPPDRADLQLIKDWIYDAEISWVGARAADRLSRQPYTAAWFYDLLKQTRTELWLTGAKPVAIDWNTDSLLLAAFGMVSEQERADIRSRTWAASLRVYFNEGRGHSGNRPPGTRRTRRKELEVDPQQWPVIEAIHYGYAEFRGRKGGGLRGLQQHIENEQGIRLSFAQIRRILRDPFVVTGEFYARDPKTDQPTLQKPVELDSPIPLEVFERNLRLLNLATGGTAKTPVGAAILNRVEFLHAEHLPQPGQPKMVLRSYVEDGRLRDWYRLHPSPAAGANVRVPRQAVEEAVVRTLLGLAENELLQKEWAQAAREKQAPGIAGLSQTERAELKRQAQALQESLSAAEAEQVNMAVSGSPMSLQAVSELTQPLRNQIAYLERQLQMDDVRKQEHRGQAEEITAPLELLTALQEVLTVQTPWDDEDLMGRRQALVRSALDQVIAYPLEDGQWEVELYGPLIPEHLPRMKVGPLYDSAKVLQRYLAKEQEPEEAGEGDSTETVRDGGANAGSERLTSDGPSPRPIPHPAPETVASDLSIATVSGYHGGPHPSAHDPHFLSLVLQRGHRTRAGRSRANSWMSPRISVDVRLPARPQWDLPKIRIALRAAQAEVGPELLGYSTLNKRLAGRWEFPASCTVEKYAAEFGLTHNQLFDEVVDEYVAERVAQAMTNANDFTEPLGMSLAAYFDGLYRLEPARQELLEAWMDGDPRRAWRHDKDGACYADRVMAAARAVGLATYRDAPRRTWATRA